MFSYYGSKKKIANLYPFPLHSKIIEPFCGAAWYSICHSNKNVLLNDLDRFIFETWDFLINRATKDILLQNRNFNVGQNIQSLQLDIGHMNFIGYNINRGSVSPRNIVQKWSCQQKHRPNFASTVEHAIVRASKIVEKIRHWRVSNLSYLDLKNEKATWFIDPPYQFGGQLYNENKIDYKKLADWCLSRKGQVIVCENSNANWLPFKEFKNTTGQRNKTKEMIFTINNP